MRHTKITRLTRHARRASVTYISVPNDHRSPYKNHLGACADSAGETDTKRSADEAEAWVEREREPPSAGAAFAHGLALSRINSRQRRRRLAPRPHETRRSSATPPAGWLCSRARPEHVALPGATREAPLLFLLGVSAHRALRRLG